MNDAACDSLERHFDTAFAAPDGIKKLRELILTLAMQGKLVAQAPNDPPASQLLKEIEAEKKRLVKEGKIKAPKPLPEIKPEEVPYALPQGWEWVRFGDLVQVLNGRAYKQNELLAAGTPVLRVGNLFTSNHWYYSDLALEDEKYIDSGDLIYAWSASFGPFIWSGDKVIYHYHIWKLAFFMQGSPQKQYLYNYLLDATDRIKRSGSGIAMLHMTKERMEKLLVPLPPISEQHRIVAKIDQLMARCDELEKLRDEREQKRCSVHAAALKQLLDAQAGDNFADTWRFITLHFGELYAVRENVTELRKAILQLAVMGKLVPQNPNDPPASQLLKENETEKKRLIKEGKIRGTRSREDAKEIKPEEMPYALPQGWEWVRLGEICEYNGRDNVAPESIVSDAWLLDLEDIEKDTSRLIYRAKYSERQSKSTKSTFQKGDVLYGKLRPYLDKVIVADADGVCTTEIVPIVPSPAINSEFLRWLLKRPAFLSHVNSLMYGVKMPRLGTEDAVQSIHPLPPISEQHRIVAKIDQLMALCDTLEQQIDAATGKQSALLDAVMAQV